MIWQMTYTHKLPKLFSATLNLLIYITRVIYGVMMRVRDSLTQARASSLFVAFHST